MSSNLEAAEALLATVEAGRARVRELSHRHLPFSRSVALEIEGRVGASPERAVLGMSHATLDLVRLASAMSGGRVEWAPRTTPPVRAEAAAPASPEAEDEATQIAAPSPALADALAGAAPEVTDEVSLELSGGLTLDDLLHDSLPEPEVNPFARADAAAERDAFDDRDDLDLDEPTGMGQPAIDLSSAASAALDPEARDDADLDERTVAQTSPVGSGAAIQIPDPSAEPGIGDPAADALADPDGSSDPDLSPVEEDTVAVTAPLGPDAEPTQVARPTAELYAAISAPRAVSPAVAAPPPADSGDAFGDAFDDSGADSDADFDADRGRRYDMPELIERNELAEPTSVAAVQLLGGGRAQALSPTLELGDAGESAEDDADLPWEDDPQDDAPVDPDNFQIAFEEPEEESSSVHTAPELTATSDMGASEESLVVVTRDGVHHRDGASVADADVEEGELEELLVAARSAERRGNLQEAVLVYGDLLSLQPSHTGAHLGRGRCLVELGDYAAAMSDFQRSEDLDATSPEPIVEMGNLFYARKEYRKAISYFDQAIELAPEHAMAWCRRGMCHQYRKSYALAFQDLQKAASLDPDIPNLRKYVQMARNSMERAGQ